MTTVTYPGVYVREVSSGVRPIAAASTSTAAFIGITEKGPIREPKKIFNFTEYENLFGGFLNSSYVSHAVLQFFRNGGSQCYIVRVTGANAAEANIVLNDRGEPAQPSLTISAVSPGIWGNRLAIVISNGTNDPANEFDLSVFWQDELTALETFANLSVVPSAPNFVDRVISSSNFIRVTYNQTNTNVGAGTSRGNGAPTVPLTGPETMFRININDDGYQEVDVQDGVGGGSGQVANLETVANLAGAIQFVVRALSPQHTSTPGTAFGNFTCTVNAEDELILTSGEAGPASSVRIIPASEIDRDASGLLNLGLLNGGIETLGSAITRPHINPAGIPPTNYYLIGDHVAPTTQVASVQAGSDGDPVTSDLPFINAFTALDPIEDVSLICVPGIGSRDVVGAGMAYCANRPLSDCFFIGDMALDDDTIEEAIDFRNGITPNNSYGAIYLPWVKMIDPTGQSAEPVLVPPSGFVAGLYAKTDAQRGVWKAPAGTTVALSGAVGLAVNFTDIQQGNLNPININVIRQFAGSGIVLWGARTVTSDPEWNYIPIRRIAIMLRVSIYNGIQWAVFEPNDEPLWASLRLNIGAFMMNLFRQGAFQGEMPSQAFFVKCDSETTTQIDIDLGIVNVLVGFAPLKPAEFVVVKISQKAGQT
jgi:uncharacterized protein